jgi:glutamine cyclotransferase
VGVVATFLYSRGRVSFLSLEKVDKTIHVYGYEIVHEFPHDPTAFTQKMCRVCSTTETRLSMNQQASMGSHL